jgi:hypothetical protein
VSANQLPLVSRIADYEPPAFGGPPVLPPLTAVRPRRAAAPPVPLRPVEDPRIRAAAVFGDAALRRVLEVLDRRRPMSQLRPLLAAGLVDSLLAVAGRGVTDTGGPARLRRVRAQPVSDHAAEISASYSRGERVHAVACRIEQVSSPTGTRWQVVALHMG